LPGFPAISTLKEASKVRSRQIPLKTPLLAVWQGFIPLIPRRVLAEPWISPREIASYDYFRSEK
jgi:hypothetical protein